MWQEVYLEKIGEEFPRTVRSGYVVLSKVMQIHRPDPVPV
jgi:hypothetical protein